MMFKVGDKVRRKPEMQNGWWEHGDKVCRILNITSLFMILEGTAQPGPRGSESGWNVDNFELVEAANTRPQAGEYWRRRDGKVVGPLKVDERSGVLHVGRVPANNPYWYATGVYYATQGDSELDLLEKVEVCANCGQPITKTV